MKIIIKLPNVTPVQDFYSGFEHANFVSSFCGFLVLSSVVYKETDNTVNTCSLYIQILDLFFISMRTSIIKYKT